MRQCRSNAELLRDKSPVLVEPFEFGNKIGEHVSIWIDKPIELIAMRGRMNARAAAVLNPIDKFVERHFVFELQRFGAFIERNDSVPRIADKTELEVSLELPMPDLHSSLFRKREIQNL